MKNLTLVLAIAIAIAGCGRSNAQTVEEVESTTTAVQEESTVHEASYRHGGRRPGNTCPPGTQWNPQARMCNGQPYAVWRPRPEGEGWVQYNRSRTDSGWYRHNCIANC